MIPKPPNRKIRFSKKKIEPKDWNDNFNSIDSKREKKSKSVRSTKSKSQKGKVNTKVIIPQMKLEHKVYKL